MKYEDLEEHKILAWYDGPILQILRNLVTNEFCIEYNPTPESYLSITSIGNLIKILKNEEPINYAFRMGTEFYEWNTSIHDYKKIDKFKDNDLFDENIYIKDIGFKNEELNEYIEKLKKLINIKCTENDFFKGVPKCIQYKDLTDVEKYDNSFHLKSTTGEIIGSKYWIYGGDWSLVITGYDPETGILTGTSERYPEIEAMEFKAIPINEAIKYRYISGCEDIDKSNLKFLELLRDKWNKELETKYMQ